MRTSISGMIAVTFLASIVMAIAESKWEWVGVGFPLLFGSAAGVRSAKSPAGAAYGILFATFACVASVFPFAVIALSLRNGHERSIFALFFFGVASIIGGSIGGWIVARNG